MRSMKPWCLSLSQRPRRRRSQRVRCSWRRSLGVVVVVVVSYKHCLRSIWICLRHLCRWHSLLGRTIGDEARSVGSRHRLAAAPGGRQGSLTPRPSGAAHGTKMVPSMLARMHACTHASWSTWFARQGATVPATWHSTMQGASEQQQPAVRVCARPAHAAARGPAGAAGVGHGFRVRQPRRGP